MADKPIIFSAPMVRALLESRKTMTRRAIPQDVVDAYYEYDDWCSNVSAGIPTSRQFEKEFFLERCRYAVGDRLWVREAWAPLSALTHNDPGCSALAQNGFYRADESTIEGEIVRWRPSIHMPKSASRLTLIVESVKVERLHDIREADALAEGVEPLFSKGEIEKHPDLSSRQSSFKNYLWHGHVGRTITVKQSVAWAHQYSDYSTAKGAFSSLWESINGPGSWDANPFVAAYSFSIVNANIDQVPA